MNLFKLLLGRQTKRWLIILVLAALFFFINFKYSEYRGVAFIVFMAVVLSIIGYITFNALKIGRGALKTDRNGELSQQGMNEIFNAAKNLTGKDFSGYADDFTNAGKLKDIPDGLPAKATIQSIVQGNSKIKRGVHEFYEVIITVKVRAQNGETWPATMTEMISIVQIPQFQPGKIFDVKYDKADKTHVVFRSRTQNKQFFNK